jgi:DNA-binding NtrC family response regulator
MALVLCTGADPEVMKERERMLERAGHTVVMATTERELAAACKENHFDVAIIGQTLKPPMKQYVVDLIRRHCSSVKILELYPIEDSRTIEDADSWIAVPDSVPPDLPNRVAELAGQAS